MLNHAYIEKKFLRLVNLNVEIYRLEVALKRCQGDWWYLGIRMQIAWGIAILTSNREKLISNLAKKNIIFPFYEKLY